MKHKHPKPKIFENRKFYITIGENSIRICLKAQAKFMIMSLEEWDAFKEVFKMSEEESCTE
jgi:hypothetical protein